MFLCTDGVTETENDAQELLRCKHPYDVLTKYKTFSRATMTNALCDAILGLSREAN